MMRKTKKPNINKAVEEFKITQRVRELEEVFEGASEALVIIRPLLVQQAQIESDLQLLASMMRRGVVSEKVNNLYNKRISQLVNISKALTGILRKDGAEEESPLRAYLESLRQRDEEGGEDGQAD